jgi:hypothetical protein
MTDRRTAISSLTIGDLFHAEGDNGAKLICLVTGVIEKTVEARTVTSQIWLEFDRRTGIGKRGNGTCEIDSIAPLPIEIRDVLLGLDQRYVRGEDPKLLDTEKRALLFVGSFYAANPI